MKYRNIYYLKNNTTYDGRYLNFHNSFIHGDKDIRFENENIIIKNSIFSAALIKNLEISNLNFSNSHFFSKVYLHNCTLNNSKFIKLFSKRSTSSGIPSSKKHGSLTINKLNISMSRIIDCSMMNMYLYKCFFNNILLKKTDLRYCFLKNSSLDNLNFKNFYFKEITFKNCRLSEIKFNNVKFDNVVFENSHLENCNFSSSELRRIKFINCILIDIDWNDVVLKKEFFLNLKAPYEKDIYINSKKSSKTTYYYKELVETYIKIKNNFRENGRYNDMSWSYLKEKESERLSYKNEFRTFYYKNYARAYKIKGKEKYTKAKSMFKRYQNFFKYILECIKYFLFGYGEKPIYILGWSIFVILLFSVLFFYSRGIVSNYLSESKITYLNSLYFSTVTFTTLGFGDIFPISLFSRVLVMLEALMGLFFYSLFVYSFGRRIAGR